MGSQHCSLICEVKFKFIVSPWGCPDSVPQCPASPCRWHVPPSRRPAFLGTASELEGAASAHPRPQSWTRLMVPPGGPHHPVGGTLTLLGCVLRTWAPVSCLTLELLQGLPPVTCGHCGESAPSLPAAPVGPHMERGSESVHPLVCPWAAHPPPLVTGPQTRAQEMPCLFLEPGRAFLRPLRAWQSPEDSVGRWGRERGRGGGA